MGFISEIKCRPLIKNTNGGAPFLIAGFVKPFYKKITCKIIWPLIRDVLNCEDGELERDS